MGTAQRHGVREGSPATAPARDPGREQGPNPDVPGAVALLDDEPAAAVRSTAGGTATRNSEESATGRPPAVGTPREFSAPNEAAGNERGAHEAPGAGVGAARGAARASRELDLASGETVAAVRERDGRAEQRNGAPRRSGVAYGRTGGTHERSGGVQARAEVEQEPYYYRPLWIEDPKGRRRLPDPVRTAAVRSVLIIAVTLLQAMVAFLCTLAGSWLAFPMVLSSVASTVVATWGVLDVWVTRQVWNQRHGVVSVPSSTARALRGERRRAKRQAREAARTARKQGRIRGSRGGAGQPAHP